MRSLEYLRSNIKLFNLGKDVFEIIFMTYNLKIFNIIVKYRTVHLLDLSVGLRFILMSQKAINKIATIKKISHII